MSQPPAFAIADAEPIRAQAREWIAWLASGAADEAGLGEFERWLQRPGHRRAFERERQLWRSLGPRPAAQGSAAQGMAATVRPRAGRRGRWRPALAAAAVLVLALASPEAWLRMRADHRSAHAAETVALPDGSRAVLDADSAIAIRYDRDQRRVELLRGRVWFEVAADPARRFAVVAGDGVIEDISTAFAVADDAGRIETAVSQGRVRVAATADGGWTYLDAGQRAAYGQGRGVARLNDVPADGIGGWRQGELLLDDAAVDAAVRELARYRAGPILIRGDLGALPKVSAALRIGRPEQALDALAASAGLSVTRLPFGVAIVQPVPTPAPAPASAR